MVEHKMEFTYVTVLTNCMNSRELVLNAHLKKLWGNMFQLLYCEKFHKTHGIKLIRSLFVRYSVLQYV